MNRKIMDGLSYGFYFVIICLIFLVVYLFFFKDNNVKPNNNKNDVEENGASSVVNENIKLNKTDVSLDIGGSFDLKVTLIPSSGKEVIKYESEDEKIVTVSETGKITGVGAGSTKIIVTVEGTNLKTECNVNVTGNTITATELFVNNEKVIMNIGEEYQLNVTVIPNNTVDKSLTFSSTDETIVTVDSNGLVKAISNGTARIIIKSNSNPNVEIFVIFRVEEM